MNHIAATNYLNNLKKCRHFCVTALLMLFSTLLHAQDIQLFTEDFETGGTSFSLNNSGPGSNTGDNNWIINAAYSGAPTYPNTTTQDNTVSGTIGGAPMSTYLHIHNQPSGILNNNYDVDAVSDQFAYTQFGICTYGMIDVHFSFFWLSEGSGTAYGSVYYSADGGAWTPIGLSQYANQSNWQYSDLTDPAFSNVGSLRFGFRWQNDNASPPSTQSFSIDDINVVSSYSSSDPVTLTVTSVAPSPVCEGNFVIINWVLSDTLCDGNYSIELSNAAGNFPSPFGTWVMPINYPQTSGATSIQLPANASASGCYKIRINRLSPDPQITGIASPCFEIIDCPNVINTQQPVVTMDPFPVCVGSAIDVPFTSTGIYTFNTYICQLSEADGTFSANPPVVGSSNDSNSYDPALGQNPGSVSGLVPDVVAGCNYYIRVVSTNPVAIGTPFGPFCIQRCDITTNNTQDLGVCLYSCATHPEGENVTVDIDINSYGNTANYLAGNEFTTQLLSSQNFGQIGPDGLLGSVTATSSTQLTIHVPCIDSLLDYGIPLGMNYLRIVSTNSSTPDNMLGTLIHFTVGAYQEIPQTITSYEYPLLLPRDTFCVGETAMLQFQPFDINDHSTFMWQCNGINGGTPFVSPSGEDLNLLFVTLGAPGTLTFSIQETNNGCVSEWTPDMEVVVLGDPVVNITGPTNVCEGDTNTYQVNFTPNTYYSWSTNATTDVIAYQDTSNNVMNIAFDNPGNYTLTIDVLNQCGEGTDNQIVHVLAFPNADAQPDTLLCIGQSTQIFTPPGAGYTYSWSDGNANVGNAASINVTPPATTDYILTVTGTGGCQAHDTVTVEIQMPDPPVVYQDSICDGNIIPITLEADSVGTYLWYEGSTTSSIEVDAVGTYDLSIDVPGMLCPHLVQYNVYLAQPDPPYIYIDSICPNGNLTLAADSVGTYEWQNGSTSSFISVHDPGTYEVSIIIPDAFCPRLVEYHVNELTPDQPILRYDSVCPNGPDNIVLSADTTGTYFWTTGAISESILVNDTGSYQVQTFQTSDRCPVTFEFIVTPDTCYNNFYHEPLYYYVPNAMTPDNDYLNDVFGPEFSNLDIVVDYSFIIMDRWGSPIFKSTDPKQKWTGNFMGGEYYVKDDVYVWQLEFRNVYETDKQVVKGHLVIIR